MPRWEQYEIWICNAGKWEMIAFFTDFDLASAMARSHSSRMRLIHATYEQEKLVSQDLLAELGTVRSGDRA